MKKIDSDYIIQSLLYLIKSIANGDIKTAVEFGIKEDQLSKLLKLSTQDLHDIANIANVNLISAIEFNPDVLDTALLINRNKSKRREEVFQLLEAGASRSLLHHLYGYTYTDVSNYRRLLNTENSRKGQGRPKAISDDDKDALYKLFEPLTSLNDPLLPELMLTAYKEFEVCADELWILLQEWERESFLGASSCF